MVDNRPAISKLCSGVLTVFGQFVLTFFVVVVLEVVHCIVMETLIVCVFTKYVQGVSIYHIRKSLYIIYRNTYFVHVFIWSDMH